MVRAPKLLQRYNFLSSKTEDILQVKDYFNVTLACDETQFEAHKVEVEVERTSGVLPGSFEYYPELGFKAHERLYL